MLRDGTHYRHSGNTLFNITTFHDDKAPC